MLQLGSVYILFINMLAILNTYGFSPREYKLFALVVKFVIDGR